MGIIRERVAKDTQLWGVTLTDSILDQLEEYAALLLDWNTRMNLTAITDPEGIAVRHFADSISLLAAGNLPSGASVIDVGTGAGFPGMVLKILRPDLEVTLLDSLNKRLVFLDALKQRLKTEVTLLHLRAEEGGRRPALRDRFDFATARAVASLPVLCEWCLPYVKAGGCFAAMKGPEAGEEAKKADRAIKVLGGCLSHTRDFVLSDGSKRSILFITKQKDTPAAYPRPAAKIQKAPL